MLMVPILGLSSGSSEPKQTTITVAFGLVCAVLNILSRNCP